MSDAIFLNVEQTMDILLGEMPRDLYASDRADSSDLNKRSYSSSEIRAHAQMFANLYSNLDDIEENKFVTTLNVNGISKWEKQLFPFAVDSSQPFDTRKQNAVTKYRATGGISNAYINALVHSVLDPLGLAFDISSYCGMNNGGWILDNTPLDVGTFLAYLDPLFGAQQDHVPLDCDLDYVAAGITAQDLLDIQTTAYTYEVRIYGNADAMTLSSLDQLLTRSEKAGSTHLIINQFPLPTDPDFIDMGPFTGDTLIDNIDCGNFLSLDATYDVWDFESF